VSTNKCAKRFLCDGRPDTFWQSDGRSGQHWIRLHVEADAIVTGLAIQVLHSALLVDGARPNTGCVEMQRTVRKSHRCCSAGVNVFILEVCFCVTVSVHAGAQRRWQLLSQPG